MKSFPQKSHIFATSFAIELKKSLLTKSINAQIVTVDGKYEILGHLLSHLEGYFLYKTDAAEFLMFLLLMASMILCIQARVKSNVPNVFLGALPLDTFLKPVTAARDITLLAYRANK